MNRQVENEAEQFVNEFPLFEDPELVQRQRFYLEEAYTEINMQPNLLQVKF